MMTSTASYRVIWLNIRSPEKWFQDPEAYENFVGLPKGAENAAACG